MLLFLGCFRPGFRAVQHLLPPHTHFSPVRTLAVTGWRVRNQGNKDQPLLLEMFAYMNPQAGWKAKITSSKNWDGSSQRGSGRSGQACLTRAKWAPLPRASKPKQGHPHTHLSAALCPLARSLRLGSHPPSPRSPSSVLESTTPGMTHRVMMEPFLLEVLLARPARRQCQAVPRKMFTSQARLSKPESTAQPGRAIPSSGARTGLWT